MHEILQRLREEDYVLDLGSRTGSFPLQATRARVIRLDLETGADGPFVQASACQLPLRDNSLAAIISNHSMEHIVGLEEAVREIARVLKPQGALYIAIPDASTLSDRIYRWASRGGGHVNAITDAGSFAQFIQAATGLEHRATRLLHSSFSFLNRHNNSRWPRRIYLVGGGYEWTLQVANHLFRWLDAHFKTRLSVYGWAFYFGETGLVSEAALENICVRCGAAHGSEWLRAMKQVKRRFLFTYFICPNCKAWNSFVDDPAGG